MGLLEVVILGVVEGLTEFLPISSTAHQEIAAQLLQIPQTPFLSSFIIAIQLGAIAAVVLLYWRTLVFDHDMLSRMAVAFIPTAVVGFALYKVIKYILLENLMVAAFALIIGGIALIVFEYWQRMRSEPPVSTITYGNAFMIGLAQAVAIVPGVSRAGATIIGGMVLGISREKIVEFSFLLAIPTMAAAAGYDLLKTGLQFSGAQWGNVALGMVISFVTAYISVRWFIRYIQTHSFISFGIYRIILGLGILAALYFT